MWPNDVQDEFTRPDNFGLDFSHPLSAGLVFAGLGQKPTSLTYNNASRFEDAYNGTLTGFSGAGDTFADRWVRINDRWGLSLDGSDDWVSLPTISAFDATNGWTFSIRWRYGTSQNYSGAVVVNGYGIVKEGVNATIALLANGSSKYDTSGVFNSLVVGTDYHVVVSGVGTGSLALWLNGAAANLANTNSGYSSLNGVYRLGSGYSAGKIGGTLSDVCCWNRVLSAGERNILSGADPLIEGWIVPVVARKFFGPATTAETSYAGVADTTIVALGAGYAPTLAVGIAPTADTTIVAPGAGYAPTLAAGVALTAATTIVALGAGYAPTLAVGIAPTADTTIVAPGAGYAPALTIGGGGGPLGAGSGGNDASVGSTDWVNVANITALDASMASVTLSGVSQSHYLTATNFGFGVPTGATIDGVEVRICATASAAGRIRDKSVRLVKGGTVQGANNSIASYFAVTSPDYRDYGGPSDLWSLSLSPSEVNDSNFGVAFSVESTSFGTETGYCDYIAITITYTETLNDVAETRVVSLLRPMAVLRATRSAVLASHIAEVAVSVTADTTIVAIGAGYAPTLSVGIALTADATVVAPGAGYAPTLVAGVALTVDTTAIAVGAGYAPTLAIGVEITAQTTVVALGAGYVPTTSLDTTSAPGGELVVASFVAALTSRLRPPQFERQGLVGPLEVHFDPHPPTVVVVSARRHSPPRPDSRVLLRWLDSGQGVCLCAEPGGAVLVGAELSAILVNRADGVSPAESPLATLQAILITQGHLQAVKVGIRCEC